MVHPNIEADSPWDSDPEDRLHTGCGSCGSDSACAESAQASGAKGLPTTAVRYGYMQYIGEFAYSPELRFTYRAKLIIQTKRGIEIGEHVPLTCSGCDKAVQREQVQAWVEACGRDSYILDAGRVLREATAADLAEHVRIQSTSREKREYCQQLADARKLPLKIVECECPIGGERIVYYFTAAERVDFRGLVKDLAKEYRTRIEMRQVGARDEARLLADFETCGQEVCCRVFLKTLKPISMRMAKLQKSTLDPTQVSGRCGRLKCCLRYEHVGYEELDKKLPRTGTRLDTEYGEGTVIGRQVITQLLQIRTEADTVVTVPLSETSEPGTRKRSARTPEVKEARTGSAPAARPRRGKPADKSGRGGSASKSGRRPPRVASSGTGEGSSGEPKDAGQAERKKGQRTRRRRPRRRRSRREGNPGGDSPGPGNAS